MPIPPKPDPTREDRVNAAVAEYLQAAESGRAPDREDFLREHADLAKELGEFLDDREHFGQVASHLTADPTISLPAGIRESATEAGHATQASLPRQVGDYELVEEIARGGMGVVYRATQLNLHRTVAVKMILGGRLASDSDVARFRSEAEAAARLDHPNIVPIYEVGEHEGQPYFSMRLVDGGNLVDYWRSNSGHPRRAAELVAVLAEAIHHAHQRGILHRDLKPRNVLLDAEGNPLITDFGLAKLLEADGSLTQSGAVVGTASYMAPEQARGDGTLTTACDIYSLGAILYELLTGRPPFRAATPAETLLDVLDKEPSPPRSFDSKIARDLSTICLKCLEKDPTNRYRSAEALALDLRRWLDGRPVEARAVSSFERFCRGCRRNPALTSVIAIAVTIIIGLTGVYIRGLSDALGRAQTAGNQALISEEETRDALARSRFEQARSLAVSGPPGRRWKILEYIGEVETLRTRERLAVALPREGSEAVLPRQCELRSIATSALLMADVRDPRRIEIDSVAQPGLTADARLAIVAEANSEAVSIMDLQEGEVVANWRNPAVRGATAFGLAPLTETALAFDASESKLLLLDSFDGHNLRELAWRNAGDPGRVGGAPRFVWSSEIVFSPDERYLAVVGRRMSDQTLLLWTLDQPDKPRALTTIPEDTDLGPPVFMPDSTKVVYPTSRNTVTVWDVADPENPSEIQPPVPLAGHIAVDAAGGRIALAGANDDPNKGTIVICNVDDGKEIVRIVTDFPLKAAPLAFHPKGDYLAAGTTDGRLFVVDVTLQETVLAVPGAHSNRVVHLRWSPDGSDLISWATNAPYQGDRGTIQCRRFASTPTREIPIEANAGPFAASMDGKRLATMHDGGRRICLLDRTRGRLVRELIDTDLRRVNHLEFTPEGHRLAAANDTKVVVWNASTGKELARLDQASGLRGLIASVAFTPEQKCLAAENVGNAEIVVWNVEEQRAVGSISAGSKMRSAQFCPVGDRLAVADGGSDRLVLYGLMTGERIGEFELAGAPIRPSAFSPDAAWIVSHAEQPISPVEAITGLSPATPNVVLTPLSADRSSLQVEGPSDFDGRACAFSPDGRLLALGYRDGSITLWDLPAGKEVLHVRYRQSPITQLAFSSQGRELLVSDGGPTIGTIDLARIRSDLASLNLTW